jgi:hypothetical protein
MRGEKNGGLELLPFAALSAFEQLVDLHKRNYLAFPQEGEYDKVDTRALAGQRGASAVE